MRTETLVCCLLGVTCCASWARAEDHFLLVTVRELAKESLQDYDEGRYEDAAAKSLKAYQVMRVPTLALNRARALVKLGKLIAASELYLEATRLERSDSWQAIQDEAQTTAERERHELLVRIPRLRITIDNAEVSRVSAAIDGVAIPAVLLESEQMVDPGARTVTGKYEQQTLQMAVAPQEGERLHVLLQFKPKAIAARSSLAPRGSVSKPEATAMFEVRRSDNHSRLAGWAALGLGGAGVVFGAIEGLAAKSKQESIWISQQCSPEDRLHCDPSQTAAINSYNTMRTLSTVGFVVGGGLMATGLVVLFWPMDRVSPRQVGLVIGPTHFGLRGALL